MSRRRYRAGAHRLPPRRVGALATYRDGRRTAEVSALAPALTAWLAATGARLLPPTRDRSAWAVHLGTRQLAREPTAHEAVTAALCRLALFPLESFAHLPPV